MNSMKLSMEQVCQDINNLMLRRHASTIIGIVNNLFASPLLIPIKGIKIKS
ncbi:MAG: hypothetical protein M1479_07650 [Actinobacteria bacterium]|nr:hypothetical protein [Cyanobacteriota bacterium]MCL5772132.1 hypothetical protein [Actinomycetota bacterium]